MKTAGQFFHLTGSGSREKNGFCLELELFSCVFVNDVYIIGKTADLLLTRGFKWVIIEMFGAAAAAPILLKGLIRDGYG